MRTPRTSTRSNRAESRTSALRGIRLQRLLAEAGICSRREAERWIEAGRVRVDGEIASLGRSVDPDRESVEVDGRRIVREPLVYWIANKPRGLLSTRSDPRGRPTVLALVPPGLPRVYPVGRLDSDTEGLVLLTNDGALAHRLLHPSLGNEREYRVLVRGLVEGAALRRLATGIRLDDGPTAPAHVLRVRRDAGRGTTRFDLVMIEGRKRQIRRMLSALGHPVIDLVRTRMGTLRLGALSPGSARPLDEGELLRLRRHAARLVPAAPRREPRSGTESPRRRAKGRVRAASRDLPR